MVAIIEWAIFERCLIFFKFCMTIMINEIFKKKYVILPVIHTLSKKQALENINIAHNHGADGVFLINHTISWVELLKIYEEVKLEFNNYWIGLNCLGLPPKLVFRKIHPETSGVWVDNAAIDEETKYQEKAASIKEVINKTNFRGIYFGGVAFKYQKGVKNLSLATQTAKKYMDVVTTSGNATGEAPTIDKIIEMKSVLEDFPLAVASGITPENISNYLPYVDFFLVAKGISKSFYELDPDKLDRLIDSVNSFQSLY